MIIEIDKGSGFCFGVTTAIEKAEETLRSGRQLSCLGDIVHNGMECARLNSMGLVTIEHEDFSRLHDATVLLRAHGEPPSTYATAQSNNITLIDATCPVVLALQKRIKKMYESTRGTDSDGRLSDIVIFGKNGHAEVLGLVGQTEGNAIVPLTVINNPGFDLPKTGGYGTWMFTIGGVALLGVAAFIVVKSRKRNEQ